MLEVRLARTPDNGLIGVGGPGEAVLGLREDTDYLLAVPGALSGDCLFVDDVVQTRRPDGHYSWRPMFYAGRVRVELRGGDVARWFVWLDVGPSDSKAGEDEFAAMVGEIRTFDATLLGGTAAATMTFGRHGRASRFRDDIALSRVRELGPAFLSAVEALVRSPHCAVSSDLQILPLSRIRRLHPSALRERRIAALVAGALLPDDGLETILLRSPTSVLTFDTPANRVLVALLQRMAATIARLQRAVYERRLGAPLEEQEARLELRLGDLKRLEFRIRRLLAEPPLREVSRSGISAAGLTQVAASPPYARAHRLGSQVLSTGQESGTLEDLLHVLLSWGIYEIWCYLAVLGVLERCLGPAVQDPDSPGTCDLAHRFDFREGERLDVYLQATLPALRPAVDSVGWTISRERRPDVLLVLRRGGVTRSMVLDAKWRSGRGNVLEAMESAHIYHDALRVDGLSPDRCVLLLPGAPAVPELEAEGYLQGHGVGAISMVRIGAPGIERLARLLGNWLVASGVELNSAQSSLTEDPSPAPR